MAPSHYWDVSIICLKKLYEYCSEDFITMGLLYPVVEHCILLFACLPKQDSPCRASQRARSVVGRVKYLSIQWNRIWFCCSTEMMPAGKFCLPSYLRLPSHSPSTTNQTPARPLLAPHLQSRTHSWKGILGCQLWDF